MPAGSKSSSLAGTCVAVHLRCLRWCGFCRLPAHTPRPLRVAHEIYRMFALVATGTYLMQECIYAYQVSKCLTYNAFYVLRFIKYLAEATRFFGNYNY